MVEWKTIEELGSFFGGLTGKTKNDFVDGNANFITYMNVFSNPSLNTSKVGTVKINEGEKQNKIQKGDILFTGSSETPEETGMSCVVTDDLKEDFYMNSFCFGLRLYSPEQVNLHYLKHILRSEPVRKSIAKTASGVTRYNISKARFSKIKIPIPSLSEQQRIVSILDTFTSSISNLKQQIEERRKQYEYERDLLLDLEGKEGVEMKKLGEEFEVKRGIRVVKKQLKENALYPVFQNSIAPMGYYDQFNRDGNMLYIICAGSSSGSIGYCYTPFWAADDCFTIEGGKGNNRYVYHVIRKNNNKLFKLVRKGSMPRLPHEAIDNMVIPLPPLSTQSRIVSILDTFEQSIANLEEQLAMREKQYEYYREKLLRFEEA
ncbi:MAG: restriction endonuclease subunit S [Bacteroidaceae bacterium]|nr:restriction endonuclease subunit S [Bacteroidaceae bacterium]